MCDQLVTEVNTNDTMIQVLVDQFLKHNAILKNKILKKSVRMWKRKCLILAN